MNRENNEQVSNSLDDPLLLETMTAAPPTGLYALVVGSVLAFVLVIILLSIAYCARNPSKRGGHHSQPLRTSSFQRLQTHPPSAPPSIVFPPAPTSTLPRNKTDYAEAKELFTIKRYRVRLSSLIQDGSFGRVYRGTYNDCQEVLVKTVALDTSETQVSLLLQEGNETHNVTF